MIIELIEAGLTEEEAIAIAIEQLGMTPDQARFYLALEQGKIKGDVIEVDDEEADGAGQ